MVARVAESIIPALPYREAEFSVHPANLGRIELVLVFAVLVLSMSPGFDWIERKLGIGRNPILALWMMLDAVTIAHLTIRLGVRWVFWSLGALWAIWLIVGFCLISSLWAPDPAAVLRRSLSLLGTTIVGTYAAMLLPPERLLRYILIAVGLVTFLGVAFAALAPGAYGTMAWSIGKAGSSDAWRGLVGHKQVFGGCLAYLAMICLAKMTGRHSRHWLWTGLFGLFGVFLVFAQSATASLCFIGAIGLVVLMVLFRQMEMPSIVARFSIFYAFGLIAFFVLVNAGTFMESIGKADTFTNRQHIWSNALAMIKDSPVLGLGYDMAWHRDQFPQFQPFTDHPHAHNGFLNLASQIGVPMTILMIGFMCVVFNRAVRLYFERPTVFNRFAVLYLGAFFVFNVTRSLLFENQEAEWIFFLTVATAVVIQDQASRGSQGGAAESRPTRRPSSLGLAAERREDPWDVVTEPPLAGAGRIRLRLASAIGGGV